MYFKYKIKNTGEYFYYSNKDNSLYTEDFSPIILDKKNTISLPKKINKINKPKILRISIGKTCNYNCSYCLQESISDKNDININAKELDVFIENILKLDLTNLFRVELWGGEPFIYWDIIKKIISSPIDSEKITWYICTNGSLINFDHIDFLDKIKGYIEIGISHDGPKQESVRGRCPLNRLIPILQRLDKTPEHYGYGFQVTVSHNNCDVYEIQEFFVDYILKNNLQSASVTYVPVESYDVVSYASTVHGDNLYKMRKSIKKLLDKNISDFLSGNKHDYMSAHSLFATSESGVFGFLRALNDSTAWMYADRCGAQWDELISLDIKGNILTCPHVSVDNYYCGSIENIEKAEIIGLAEDNKNNYSDCLSCPSMLLCQYGCSLKVCEAYRVRSCDALFNFYLEVIKATFKFLFKSEIEYIGKEKEK